MTTCIHYRYNVIGKKQNLIALECRLYTGKTHQIRVHLKDALGVEILNDRKYGHAYKGAGANKNALYLHCKTMKLRYNGHDMRVLDVD